MRALVDGLHRALPEVVDREAVVGEHAVRAAELGTLELRGGRRRRAVARRVPAR